MLLRPPLLEGLSAKGRYSDCMRGIPLRDIVRGQVQCVCHSTTPAEPKKRERKGTMSTKVKGPPDEAGIFTDGRPWLLCRASPSCHRLVMIAPLNRAQTEALTLRIALCRAVLSWEVAEVIDRTLVKLEPDNIRHVDTLEKTIGHRKKTVTTVRAALPSALRDLTEAVV
jgi:hypothetical protein